MPTLTAEQIKKGIAASVQARRTYAAQRKEYAQLVAKLARLESPQQPAQQTIDVEKRLARVAKQIELLNSRIDEEAAKVDCDGQRVNWLSQAIDRLAEQERILAGRPLPGTLKPSARPSRRAPLGNLSPDSPQ